MPPRLSPLRVVLGAAVAALALQASCATRAAPEPQPAASTEDPFVLVAKVLRHPRCLNCHPTTDFPRVGDDRRRHAMNVLRGPDDEGLPAMRCTSCHQPDNQPLVGVPGAPHWKLAPLSMGWDGLDDHDLAEALKDRRKNGDRSLDEILEHMADDPLVGWGWDPGPGRESVPVPREEFVESVRRWIDGGAVSPPPGTTSTF